MPRSPSPRRRAAGRGRRLLRHSATFVRRYAPLLLAAIAFVLVLAVATRLFPHHSANHDEAVYLQQAAMLLDGRLTLRPPVEDAFRPWFFVEDGDTLYPKYAPVVAAFYALPYALGVPRLALGLVAAIVVLLTSAIGRLLFDRATGLLAGALLLTSPLFVLDTATFLPYAPTTALNLVFAYGYLRAEDAPDTAATARLPGQAGTRWAALAGAAIGLAFFARPYTAVLFAAPFIGHAVWTLLTTVRGSPPGAVAGVRRRRLATAATGLAGVGLALAYNWRLTGDPFRFPYEAFAPLDGLGFGHRELLGHGIEYTPALAVRVNAEVLSVFLTEWAPLGVVGSLLAAAGLLLARVDGDWRHGVVASIFGSVALGNVLFWGNHNILGALGDAGDGLVAILGPYYHFDLLLPTAVFAASGIVTAGRAAVAFLRTDGVRDAHRAIVLGLLVVGAALAGGSTVAAFADPVERNAGVTAEYETAYEPVTGQDAPTDAVVFLPAPYGPWLNHPFQTLRNDPGFDGDAVYALQTNEFAILDEYPDRDYYRYGYRGTWNPYDGTPVEPVLQPVSSVSGDTVTAAISLDLPANARSTSIRLATDAGHAYYAAPANDSARRLAIHVDGTNAWVTGPGVEAATAEAAAVGASDEVVLVVNVNRPGGDVAYRVVLPVSTADGDRRALTPRLEVCTVPRFCGGEATYVPGASGSGYGMNVTLDS